MGAKHLSKRGNWQRGARIIGDKGENDIVSALASELPDHYEIHLKPPKLKVYPAGRGIALDALITNKESGKKLFLEKKTGNNGGNAHERVYKFLSPSLQKKVSGEHNAADKPFFFIFSGDTFQGEKYKNEFSLLLREENYAIMKRGFTNASEVAKQIMEII
jgi:hypothetical protein